MRRHNDLDIWLLACYNAASSRLCYCLLFDKVGKMWNLKPNKAFLKKMQLYLECFISPCMVMKSGKHKKECLRNNGTALYTYL